MKRMARLILPLGTIAVAMIGCRGVEGPTAPSTLAPQGAARVQGVDQVVSAAVRPLLRSSPLTVRYEVSQMIGRQGGQISLPALGLTLTFPFGAVTSPTMIQIVAKPGAQVSYEFYPHMTFNAPVLVTQDLSFTETRGNPSLVPSLIAAYFPDDIDSDFLNSDKSAVKVEELRAVTITGGVMSFTVNHFSGYLASSGRCDAAIDNDR